MSLKRPLTSLALFLPLTAAAADARMPPPEPYCEWKVENYELRQPLCGLEGNAERGRAIAADSYSGNCVACHRLPIDETDVFGNIGPDLTGIASRYTESQIRIRVTDTRQINPMSIMPGYYRDPAKINRPAKGLEGRTFLTAQQVEDVVAFLKTLK